MYACCPVVHVYFFTCMYVPKVCVCEHMAALLVIIEYAYVICILCIARRVRLLGVASMHVLIHTTSGVVLIASSMYTLVV